MAKHTKYKCVDSLNHSPAEGNTCDGHGNTLKEATVKGYMSNRPQAVDP